MAERSFTSDQVTVLAAVKNIFLQTNMAGAKETLIKTVIVLEEAYSSVAEQLLAAEEEALAYPEFPSEHHREISSINQLERLNKEINRRTAVVGSFPIASRRSV